MNSTQSRREIGIKSVGHRVRAAGGTAEGKVLSFDWQTYLVLVKWDVGGTSFVHRMYLEAIDG